MHCPITVMRPSASQSPVTFLLRRITGQFLWSPKVSIDSQLASSQPTDLCFLRDKPSPLPGNHCLASQPVQSIDRFPGPFLQLNRNQHAHLLSACGEMCKSSHPKITKTSSSHPAGQVLLPNLCAKVL